MDFLSGPLSYLLYVQAQLLQTLRSALPLLQGACRRTGLSGRQGKRHDSYYVERMVWIWLNRKRPNRRAD